MLNLSSQSPWRAAVSKSSGKRYWRHSVTGETTWTKPAKDLGEGAVVAAVAASPRSKSSVDAGAHPHANPLRASSVRSTTSSARSSSERSAAGSARLSQLAAPAAPASPLPAGASPLHSGSAAVDYPSRSGAALPTPPMWQVKRSVTTGRQYWRNAHTGEVQWKAPSAGAEEGVHDHSPSLPRSRSSVAAVDASVFSQANPLRDPTGISVAHARPAAATAATAAVSAEPLSQGAWAACVSKSSGRTYYRHSVTGETRWDAVSPGVADVAPAAAPTVAEVDPAAAPLVAEVAPAVAPAARASPTKLSDPGAGWVACVSKSSGRAYLRNPVTGETKWASDKAAEQTAPLLQLQQRESRSQGTRSVSGAEVGTFTAENPMRRAGSSARAAGGSARTVALAAAPSPAPAALPAAATAWVEQVSRSSGRRYWRNNATGETSWTDPARASLSSVER